MMRKVRVVFLLTFPIFHLQQEAFRYKEVWVLRQMVQVLLEPVGDHALPNLSLRWMLDKLSGHYQFAVPPALPKDNPSGLAHWSIGDKRANAGSKCIDRTPGSDISPAVADRANAGLVPIRVLGEERKLKYPLKCKSPTNKKEPIPANEGATS